MMPGAFEDVEDGTLRARDIFGCNLASSNAACHLRGYPRSLMHSCGSAHRSARGEISLGPRASSTRAAVRF